VVPETGHKLRGVVVRVSGDARVSVAFRYRQEVLSEFHRNNQVDIVLGLAEGGLSPLRHEGAT
jgi:hypothetical protein